VSSVNDTTLRSARDGRRAWLPQLRHDFVTELFVSGSELV